MTDDLKELLTLAAKAAGIYDKLAWTPGATPWLRVDQFTALPWNPSTDDGDAFRLAVKLSIAVDCTSARCWAWNNGWTHPGVMEEFYGSDPLAATRMAILRAAAEIGRAMP